MPESPEKRARRAARFKERYRREPEYQLRRLNYNRASKGLPLLTSLSELGRDKIILANSRQRDEKGRWL